MVLCELSEILRKVADEIDEALVAEALPPDKHTIWTAHRAVRDVVGEKAYVNIGMEVAFHYNSVPEVEWRVWDGKIGYIGRTLDSAVNSCLSAISQHSPGEVDAAQSTILESSQPDRKPA